MPFGELEKEIALAFATESIYAARNRLYAQIAKKAGEVGLAGLLAAVAMSEEIHAKRILMHLRGKVGDLDSHLQTLIRKINADHASEYAELATKLAAADKETASEAFTQFAAVARNHSDHLDTIQKQTTTSYHVCQVCGYIEAGEPPERCPVCNAVRKKFKESI